jgi:phenylacetic acid degradation operon negative regulatory protein
MPRHRPAGLPSDGSARSLLLTVLSELVVPADEPVWTRSLLYALAGLGVSEHTGRQTLARASRRGWIDGERRGREVRWTATRHLETMLEELTRRVESLSSPPKVWDGDAIFLNVVVPLEKKAVRPRLYSALAWAGFGNPMPGLWASPHVSRLDEARAAIDELGLRGTTIAAIGRLADGGLRTREVIERSWDLDAVAVQYVELLRRYEHLSPGPGDEVLFSYLSLVHEWRGFPAIDPQLPEDVLPDWIGRTAADTFVTLRARWEPAMRHRWREVVDMTAPGAAATP